LYQRRGVTVGGDTGAERISAIAARPSLLRMLGAEPVRGRVFTEEEAEPGADRKVLLSHGYWQRAMGGREVIGSDVRLNGLPYQVVGVLAEGFQFVDPDINLWIPLSFTPQQRSDEARHSNS